VVEGSDIAPSIPADVVVGVRVEVLDGRGGEGGVSTRSGKREVKSELEAFQVFDLRAKCRFSSVVVWILPVVAVSSSCG
jgi:hypothetical protein